MRGVRRRNHLLLKLRRANIMVALRIAELINDAFKGGFVTKHLPIWQHTMPRIRAMRVLILAEFAVMLSGCITSQKTTAPLPVGKDTYTLNVVTPTYYAYSSSQIRNAAMVAASQHCAKSNKVMIMLDIDSSGNNFSSRMSSDITYRCADESDPAYRNQPPIVDPAVKPSK